MSNKKLSEETKRKISESVKKTMQSVEIRKKISKAHKGRKISKEHRQKISDALMGIKRSKEMKRKLSIINTGKKHSKETKKKIGDAQKGRKHSEEHVLKVSISQIKCRIDGYCNAWGDEEFKNDCRKDYCEICKIEENKTKGEDGRIRSNLLLHHKDLNKKNCHPNNFSTFCRSCHTKLHNLLR